MCKPECEACGDSLTVPVYEDGEFAHKVKPCPDCNRTELDREVSATVAPANDVDVEKLISAYVELIEFCLRRIPKTVTRDEYKKEVNIRYRRDEHIEDIRSLASQLQEARSNHDTVVSSYNLACEAAEKAERTLSLCNDVCDKWLHSDDSKLGAFEGFKQIHDLTCGIKEAEE